MRIENLLKLLTTERSKRSVQPKTIASKKNLNSLLYMGISDIYIATIIVPKIVDLEISSEFSKEKLKEFIKTNNKIELLPNPVRHALDDSIEQRRIDSLSRLLSLETIYTPCVAVAFYNGEIIASSNAPNPKEKMTDAMLADCLSKKMGLIQDFLFELIKDIPPGSQPHIEKIQFSIRAKLLATETVLKIIDASNGGVGEVVPTTKDTRHKNRQGTVEHLQNALLKLGQHCLFGVFTNGKKGFTLLELISLLSDSMTIVTPNTVVLMGKQLHAEQAILYYLNEYTNFNRGPLTEQLNIGISKLCCQACHNVLNRNNKISYRGSHGMKFPSVYDIDTEDLFEGIQTKLGADLCPSDSDSEFEVFSDEEDFDDEIPAVKELLIGKEEVSTKSRYILFKPSRMKVTDNELNQQPSKVIQTSM